jgi:tetratricopeptide (TPR) repeat protein
MKVWRPLHNLVVAALLPLFLAALPAFGQTPKLDDLLDRLKTAEPEEAARIEAEIWIEWSKSGSAAMDLLLERGRQAMAAGDMDTAIEHFTALIDHAPDFAEAWDSRATAYYQAGDIGPALADIAQTLRLNPRHFGALSGLAMIFQEGGQTEKALEVWKLVAAIHPNAPGVSEAITAIETDLQGREL